MPRTCLLFQLLSMKEKGYVTQNIQVPDLIHGGHWMRFGFHNDGIVYPVKNVKFDVQIALLYEVKKKSRLC